MIFIEDLDPRDKCIFLRVDFNVPLDDSGKIRSDARIRASLPTLNFLLGKKARVIAASHLGRPKGQPNPKLSLKPIAHRLSELISNPVILAPDVIGDEVRGLKTDLKAGQVLLLENLRFHPGETANDSAFARELAEGVDYYVNDAFGASHRAHASVVAITGFVKKSAAGYLLKKEVDYLSKAVLSPAIPYVAILGGAKVSDKIAVIENLLNKADDILIGGAMAYTFLSARGYGVGRSLIENDKKELALDILQKAKEKKANFHLPLDHLLASAIEEGAETRTVSAYPFPEDWMGVDIGPQTIDQYIRIIARARTVFWNGPLGVFEVEKFSKGTLKIAEAVARSSAISIVGGGDSVAAVSKAGVSEKISHISTGGGASLEFIANETLPGLEALGWKK
jgi:phosphoglycerate kinase